MNLAFMRKLQPYAMNETAIHRCDFRFFEKKECLGSGSYSRVQLLCHKKTKQLVVAKLFLICGSQEIINTRLADAEREAKILGRIKHKNIVRVLGTTVREDNDFVIFLEYVACGDLERLLLLHIDIPLSWKIRSRFFHEIASALAYLHYHDPKRSYIHGDLKPQNVLLGNLLTIKLADFGATSIAKATGETTEPIVGSTQHTPFYTAPEYLKKLTEKRQRSMDVYSYGMIGYEILTRRTVYSGSQVPHEALIYMIKFLGQKPNESYIDEVASELIESSSDSMIFYKLKSVVSRCWQTKAEDRPKISNVKRDLDKLALNEQIYDKATDAKITFLIEKRKLNSRVFFEERSSEKYTFLLKVFQKSVVSKFALCFCYLTIFTMFVAIASKIMVDRQKADDSVVFLAMNETGLIKHDIGNKTVTTLLHFPKSYVSNFHVPNFVKVNNIVYVISEISNKSILRVNLSQTNLFWETLNWNEQYKYRSYIAHKDSIFSVGAQYDYLSLDWKHRENFQLAQSRTRLGCDHAYLYNVTTNVWTRLRSMNQPRLGHTLVLFKDLICAVGGSLSKTAECYNSSTNQWTNLPQMTIARRGAAAVELNGELFVMGGELFTKDYTHNKLDLVEKYNPVTNTWTKVSAGLMEAREHINAGVYRGKIYVFGGFSNLIAAYDPSENIWKKVGAISEGFRYTKFFLEKQN